MYKEKAVKYFSTGYNCAQSVLLAFCDEGEIDTEVVAMLTSPYGSGISGQGNICGCVNGAIMALGLRTGKTTVNNNADRKKIYALTKSFCTKFVEKHGHLNCRELIKLDLSKNEDLKRAIDEGVFKNRCSALVLSATEIVSELIS